MSSLLTWDEQFPKGYGHTSIAFLKRCPGYEDAKKGDINAAEFVVSRCVKQKRILELREKYPDSVLLPVIGNNKLPLALAKEIGMPINTEVRLVHIIYRKLLCAMERLLHKPVFMGHIERDLSYIIVDDVVTQGGTAAALREFIMIHGGAVVAVTALAFSVGCYYIAPTEHQVVRLLVKFGIPILSLLRIYGIASEVRELTNSQIRYLLRFSSIRNIERRIAYFVTVNNSGFGYSIKLSKEKRVINKDSYVS